MRDKSNRQEALRQAAERAKRKKEKAKREEEEFYQRTTSGPIWKLFLGAVVFCTLMSVATTIDIFVDGKTEKLTKADVNTHRELRYDFHKALDVKGYLFAPHIEDWFDYDTNSLELTYSPIFRTGKKLSYNMMVNDQIGRKHVEIRQRSIFTWFPIFQIFLLVPLITYIFRRPSPFFNFGRIASLVFVFPGTLMVLYFSILT